MSALDTATAGDLAVRRALLRLIAIGGTAVLASYLLALDPEIGGRLWGGIPEGRVRQLYTLNMLLAAVAFFPATWQLVLSTPASALRARTGAGYEVLTLAYAAILMGSALWLPLMALLGEHPSGGLWLAIRAALLVVGAGATALGAMLARLARRGSTGARLAALAYVFFWLQTMVLDALVWPHYYSTGT